MDGGMLAVTGILERFSSLSSQLGALEHNELVLNDHEQVGKSKERAGKTHYA
jgi:hypothetical protein